jgi:hypothetical protein
VAAAVLLAAAGILAYNLFRPPSPEVIQAALEKVLKPRACSRLEGAVGEDLFVKITGHVENEMQRREVIQSVQGIKGVPENGVDASEVTVMPRPFCLVLDFLEDNSAIVSDQALPSFDPKDVYKITDPLVLKVKAPEGQDSFIHVLFIDQNGAAAFLFPHARDGDNRMSPGEEISVGAAPGEQTKTKPIWRVGEPAGWAMAVVLTAPFPILPDPPPYVMQNQEELQTLLASLETNIRQWQEKESEESGFTNVLSRYKLLKIEPKG